MQLAFVTDVLVPLCLIAVMFGMGTGLKKTDFQLLLRTPRSLLGGIVGQFVLLPLLAFSVCLICELPAHYAIGLMIIGACPGGTLSNVFSQLSRANVALSVSLTAISSLLCIVTAPLIIKYAVAYFGAGETIQVSVLETSLGMFLVSILPASCGMLFGHFYPRFAQRTQPFFRKFSAAVITLIVVAVLTQQWQALNANVASLLLAALLMHGLATVGGLFIARLFGLSEGDRKTVGIEVGIQNAAMAVVIAMSILAAPELAVAGTVYGLVMFIGGTLLSMRGKLPRLAQAR